MEIEDVYETMFAPGLKVAARQGDIEAQYILGNLYYSGRGVEQSYVKAKHYFELAADHGHSNSQSHLGYLYYYGEGVVQDYDKAIYYYELAAEQGHSDAQLNLWNLYSHGICSKQDYEWARHYFDLATKDGTTYARRVAEFLYGMSEQLIDWTAAQQTATNANQHDAVMVGFKALLLHPNIFPSSRLEKSADGFLLEWRRAVEVLVLPALAADGDPWAQWLEGMHEYHVKKDYDSAKRLWQLAAKQGHVLGENSLGELYQEDDQLDLAECYYMRAAVQGHADAQYNLAMLYEPDYQLMQPHLEKAASQGHAESLYILGTLYANSDVLQQDPLRARSYFHMAAAVGHVGAQAQLQNDQHVSPNCVFLL